MTNFRPLVSVIMPAHNAAKTIRKAIQSTLIALPRNSELLVFIDGCSDETERIVAGFEDPRIKVIVSEVNVGVAAALNTMIQSAVGEFIARMDADDICLPYRFRLQLREIRKRKSDFVFSNAILFGRSLTPLGVLPQFPFRLTGESVKFALVFGNPFVHPTMLARASALERLGGYRKLPAEDYDLWIRASKEGLRMSRTNAYGILYRVHSSQLTQQKSWQAANSECVEVRDGRNALAGQLLGHPPVAGMDLSDYRPELIRQIIRKGKGPTRALVSLIGIKATVRAIGELRVSNE
jgi:glycosyltransferase involved in cell wall biosynthesis